MIKPQDDRRPPEEAPEIAQQDWDEIEGAEIRPADAFQNGDLRYRRHEGRRQDHSSDEEDDNAYQESDEALPDDREEAALRRDPTREKSRFDEV
ncbi:MAG TPA: hypothetical protein VHC00_20445 [Rhizobiaceae bacterium]|nr:hypothetical protein [Rhizobiaceae bacterium]